MDQVVSGECEECSGCEFEQGISEGNMCLTSGAFSAESYVREERDQFPGREGFSTYWAVTSTRHNPGFARSDAIDEYGRETPEEEAEYEEGSEEEDLHEVNCSANYGISLWILKNSLIIILVCRL